MSATSRGLVIIACGVLKTWDRNFFVGPTAAKDAYISSSFRLHRKYAETFGTDWRILSAWYGITHPDQLICDYDAKFRLGDLGPSRWWWLQGMFQQARAVPRFESGRATRWENLSPDRPEGAARRISCDGNRRAIRRP